MGRPLGLASQLLGRAAACSSLQTLTIWDAAACSSSSSPWLQAAASAGGVASSGNTGGPAALAAAALRSQQPCCSRAISSSSTAQHIAEPAPVDHAQQQQQQQPYERTCWQCGTPLGAHTLFFCPSCQSVQPASDDPPLFELFGIDEPRFDLDVQQLERQYKALQLRLHPDRFSTASSLEQEYAHQQASVVNHAYDVLKRPLRRAHYILNQRGFGACEGMTITDPELLLYVMEAREEVESTNDKQRLQQQLDSNRALEERCIQELATAFHAADLQHAAELTTQLRYICRIKEAILEKL